VATCAIVATAPANATEEPSYRILERGGGLEVRAYDPMVIAETVVPGCMDRAGGDGFRLLAEYIFNRNGGQSGDGTRIAMTAPVGMQAEEGGWRVHFVMPRGRPLDALPEPADPRVRLRGIPPQKVVALRFSGLAGKAKVEAEVQAALAWMRSRGLEAASEPVLARYDPPWTLPFLRRNEILIPVR
jgi:hypothetical protein